MSYLDNGPPRLQLVGLRELSRAHARRVKAEEEVKQAGGRAHHACQAAILGLTSGGMVLLAIAPLNGPGFALAGFALLLIAQPFWLVATWRARQWGMFVNAIVYAAATIAGLYTSLAALPRPTVSDQVGQHKLLAQNGKSRSALPALPESSRTHARARDRAHT